ncbi:MAG: DUF378 domain-containing protein [Oscillospiraceae bacterium]|nr:DUF378 domain-containing protein [Oscillospiraceae bacterium]
MKPPISILRAKYFAKTGALLHRNTARGPCYGHIACTLGGNTVKLIDRLALILVIVGALNWGSVGIFGFDCVAFLCGGQMAVLSRIIYSLVGLAGLWCITLLFRDRDEE